MIFLPKKVPSSIEPCPIIEAVMEIRFSPRVPDNAIFGMIYANFQDKFANYVKLPILQIPEPIREQDPDFLYKPHYSAQKDNLLFKIGPRVFSLTTKKEYIGWSEFSPAIKACCAKLKALDIINSVTRIGLRYINFFKMNKIYGNTELSILTNSMPLEMEAEEIYLSTRFKSGQFSVLLQIHNQIEMHYDDVRTKGSIIDIDVSLLRDNIKIDELLNGLVNECHEEEKKVFFGLLNDDFLKTFTVEY